MIKFLPLLLFLNACDLVPESPASLSILSVVPETNTVINENTDFKVEAGYRFDSSVFNSTNIYELNVYMKHQDGNRMLVTDFPFEAEVKGQTNFMYRIPVKYFEEAKKPYEIVYVLQYKHQIYAESGSFIYQYP